MALTNFPCFSSVFSQTWDWHFATALPWGLPATLKTLALAFEFSSPGNGSASESKSHQGSAMKGYYTVREMWGAGVLESFFKPLYPASCWDPACSFKVDGVQDLQRWLWQTGGWLTKGSENPDFQKSTKKHKKGTANIANNAYWAYDTFLAPNCCVYNMLKLIRNQTGWKMLSDWKWHLSVLAVGFPGENIYIIRINGLPVGLPVGLPFQKVGWKRWSAWKAFRRSFQEIPYL